MKPLPKSYVNGNKPEGLSQNAMYAFESGAALEAGDYEATWEWLALAELPAYTLMFLKEENGADFIRKWGFKTEKAEQAYGKDWLEK